MSALFFKHALRALFPELWKAFDEARHDRQLVQGRSAATAGEVMDAMALERAAWIKLHSAWYAYVHNQAFAGQAPDADRMLSQAD